MARWEPDSRGRLVQAALELYGEQGFDDTTVAQIAERAGLTERTFFRYFVDKREVLFWGSAALQDLMVSTVADAPEAATPIDAVAAAVESAGAAIDGRGEASRQRNAVVAANPSLQERELIKLAALGSALTDALSQRGVGPVPAALAAEAGIAVFRVGVERWILEDDARPLPQVIRELFDELKSVTAGE